MLVAALLLALLLAGSLVYCVLVVVAARQYRLAKPPPLTSVPGISILKPLAGVDEGLEVNLRTFFEQNYPNYELLFAVRHAADPAAETVQKLRAEYPHIPSTLLLVGEPPYANAKVWSLERMTAAARHDLLVMSDSDIRVTQDMLSAIAAEFQDPTLGVSSCPYRATPGSSFWSLLEAIGMNTEFLSGVIVARLIEGVRFALGPTSSARREVIEDVGGWPHLAEFLAEDFVLGNTAAEKGWRVILSSYVIEHRIGAQGLRSNLNHRTRWNRSTRRSRPAGYLGQLFTNPLPLAFLLCALQPAWWPVLLPTVLLRAFAAWATAGWILRDKLTGSRWFLVPVQDLLSFVLWIAGFYGNEIRWRGRKYMLLRDGRFRLLERVNAPD